MSIRELTYGKIVLKHSFFLCDHGQCDFDGLPWLNNENGDDGESGIVYRGIAVGCSMQ
jgi:hypothetical protein